MTRRRLRGAPETILHNPRSVSIVLNRVDFSRNKCYYSRYGTSRALRRRIG
jgi:hypothetical protein